jgi:hypothetical protein
LKISTTVAANARKIPCSGSKQIELGSIGIKEPGDLAQKPLDVFAEGLVSKKFRGNEI